MSKKSVSSIKRQGRSTAGRQRIKQRSRAPLNLLSKPGTTGKKRKAMGQLGSQKRDNLAQMHFFGVCLGGGKAGRSSVAELDYFFNQGKVFLGKIHEKLDSGTEEISDNKILRVLTSHKHRKSVVAFNVPLQVPKCLRCRLRCPGYDKCKVSEIQWLRKNHSSHRSKKKPRKMFTPYTQRCVEQFVATSLEETFYPQHALGANMAPLTARAQYLLKHIQAPTLEVMPEVSVWRIGRALGVRRSQLAFYKHSTEGESVRKTILHSLIERDVLFIYEQDVNLLERNPHVFEALITGLTAYLAHRNKCESRPRSFPKQASWIAIPKLDWL